jgi:hypothetical protein
MAKMTRLSVENLKVADEIKIEKSPGGYIVRVSRGGSAAYLQTSDGIMTYPSPYHAIRAIKRHTDVKPTTI